MSGTLVAVTFLTGLVPVVGNLVSNTAIVVISLGSSVWVAVSSLAFLIAIHKLEYFVNARIVGARIDAAAWEILIALLAFEAAFGVPGLVLAPILYAYASRSWSTAASSVSSGGVGTPPDTPRGRSCAGEARARTLGGPGPSSRLTPTGVLEHQRRCRNTPSETSPRRSGAGEARARRGFSGAGAAGRRVPGRELLDARTSRSPTAHARGLLTIVRRRWPSRRAASTASGVSARAKRKPR